MCFTGGMTPQRHVEHILDVEALVEGALAIGDHNKAILVLLDAIIINNQNLENCAKKLNEMIDMLNLQQKLLEAIIGAEGQTKH